MNTNCKVIGLTVLGIKPESTAPEADALTSRSSALKMHVKIQICPLLAVEQNFAFIGYKTLMVILHTSRVKSENVKGGGGQGRFYNQ